MTERTQSHRFGIRRNEASTEELRLIRRISEGDRHAFEELYRVYHPRLRRFLFTLCRSPQLVEELLDDTMMVVWNSADRFQGASKPSTWIFAIAYRKAGKAMRRHEEPIEDDELESRPSLDDGPEEEHGRRRTHELLVDAMNGLSAEHRAVVDLTYFHEMGYREIAEIMHCPAETVKTRMFYARRHLRRLLSGDASDWI